MEFDFPRWVNFNGKDGQNVRNYRHKIGMIRRVINRIL